MSKPRLQNNEEEDDPDLLALRAEALSTLILKQKKEVENVQQQRQPAYPPYHERHHLNHPPRLNGSQHYVGIRPEYNRNHFPLMDAHPRVMQPMGPASFGPQGQPFLSGRPPMMPLIQPHVNPNFVSQPTPLQGIPIHRDFSIPMEEDMPVLSLQEPGSFEPTPPSRLSPRSAMFVAKNEEALRRQKVRRRSSSSDRSRSRSPYKYRPRSRSPHQKLQHIARKRTRSKSPIKDRRSRSPRRRSQGKRISPKYSDRRRFNVNRDRRRDTNERKPLHASPKIVEEKRENESTEEVKESKSPTVVEFKPNKEEKREKTEQEIEDELLASSEDESVKEAKLDDEDELKLTADDNDLDFLDDDDEESENEGRFKGKETTAPVKKPTVTSSFKSSYDRRDKPYSRYDYKRDSRRDRKSSRSRSPVKIRRKSPEQRKSPEISRKPTKEPTQSKIIVINKKTDETKKPKTEKPLFKSTFNMVEPPTQEKKKEDPSKKEDAKERLRLVRPSAINRVEPLKIEKPEKNKEAKAEKAIMKRLGGYIKDSTSTKALKPAWAKDQA